MNEAVERARKVVEWIEELEALIQEWEESGYVPQAGLLGGNEELLREARLSLQALLVMQQDSPSTEIERLRALLRALYGTVSTRSDWRKKWPVIDRNVTEALREEAT